MVNDLKEAQDVIKKLNDSIQNEKRLSAAKDTTIKNLRHEIDLLDEELIGKRKENDKCNEEMRKTAIQNNFAGNGEQNSGTASEDDE